MNKFKSFYNKTIAEDVSKQERASALKNSPVFSQKIYTVILLVRHEGDDPSTQKIEVKASTPQHAASQGVLNFIKDCGFDDKEAKQQYQIWASGNTYTADWELGTTEINVEAVYLGKLINLLE